MKILFGVVMLMTTLLPTKLLPERSSQNVEMMLLADEALQSQVKIFDYNGNLLNEMNTKDVSNNDISIKDYFLLESSDYAFQYLGDYYYLREQ